MSIKHLTENSFDAEISEGVTLVDFWATWCGPCRMQAPILEELDKQMEGKLKIAKVDVDSDMALAKRYRVMSIPTLLLFKNGQLISRKTGLQDSSSLKEMLENV